MAPIEERTHPDATLRHLARAARRALGIEDLVLVVHDASFPSDPGEDIGRGTPYSRGARRLCAFADALGFTGLLLGPQGVTTSVNRSPYDATVFSRNPLSIAFEALHGEPSWEGLLDAEAVESATSAAPRATGRVHHAYAEQAQARLLERAFRRFAESASTGLRARFGAFRDGASWLEHDCTYEALAAENGGDDSSRWPPSSRTGYTATKVADRYAFGQFVVHAQHDAFRSDMRRLGWKLFGDMQIGLSQRDQWQREALFIDAYALGAPPSRTDPQGQPWGYPVLKPDSEQALSFFRARARKMAMEYDGVRLDHPHGLVCPWVYERANPESLVAVAHGARLFESPDLTDHPALARYALVRPEQLDLRVPRHADGWVRWLDEEQLQRYQKFFAVVVGELQAAGGKDLICEVLSTAPYPLVSVLQRFGLGRFRVTQKADLRNPSDVYRSENAKPNDWVMIGTHDTLPLSLVVDDWFAAGTATDRAFYLAQRLVPNPERRPEFADALVRDRSKLLRAMFADLLASPARHVLVFMSDLFGLREVYNRPGTVSSENWGLRLRNDFEAQYDSNLLAGTAMDVAGALALALRARAGAGMGANSALEGLAAALEGDRSSRVD
ncbi:MAG: 4-alpha-glucanotransferase [Myxococcota bacterium]|nr:4-alpha-glucanotransferase [Myxococcota bacterium]